MIRTVLFANLLLTLQPARTVDFLDILQGDGFGGGAFKKRMTVNRIGQCLGQKDLPIYLPDFKVTQYNRTTHLINGEIIFREDFPNGWAASATIKKCDDFSSAASCRPFLDNIANSDVCSLLGASDAVYYPLMAKIEPKAQCPFRKGTYVLTDQPVLHELTRFLPGSGSTYWEIKSVGKVGDRVVSCLIIQLNAKPVKTKGS